MSNLETAIREVSESIAVWNRIKETVVPGVTCGGGSAESVFLSALGDIQMSMLHALKVFSKDRHFNMSEEFLTEYLGLTGHARFQARNVEDMRIAHALDDVATELQEKAEHLSHASSRLRSYAEVLAKEKHEAPLHSDRDEEEMKQAYIASADRVFKRTLARYIQEGLSAESILAFIRSNKLYLLDSVNE